MTIVLRLMSLFIALQVVLTIRAIAWLARSGFLAAFVSGGLGRLTLAAWVMLCVVGPVGAVQLWRLRESGRYAAIVFTTIGILYYMIGGAMYRSAEAPPLGLAIGLFVPSVLLLILLLPAAKRACAAPGGRVTQEAT
ncbi:MAG TPA: hypothetical protein VFB92_13205 [Vicinamibacterales bacterium]|nr:hypothetical protein [Vicinamibacterales bacterium]